MEKLEFFYKAKYHYSVVQRMFENYEKFPDKRLVMGIINESANAVFCLVRAYVFLEKKTCRNFQDDVINFRNFAKKYFDDDVCMSLLKLIEIQKESRASPIGFQKDEKIIFLIDGKYKILTVERLRTLIENIKYAIFAFPVERQL
ncbi:MAG: hypothetical protein Q8N88_02265 [Nanoarchaeota archaeon]|nr:hypothetical protein [Nanoarchaeota archaeon]